MFIKSGFFVLAAHLAVFAAGGLPALPAKATTHIADKSASIAAGEKCLKELRSTILSNKETGADVACDIPIILSEAELDTILRRSFDFKSLRDAAREQVKSFSNAAAKTLVNARAARCVLTIRLSRKKLVRAAAVNDMELEVQPQPVSCRILTKADKWQPISFTFRPKLEVKDKCVKSFAPRMGEIKTPCTICWPVNLSRLYLTTKIVSLWVNHVGKNFDRVLNGLLARECVSD